MAEKSAWETLISNKHVSKLHGFLVTWNEEIEYYYC